MSNEKPYVDYLNKLWTKRNELTARVWDYPSTAEREKLALNVEISTIWRIENELASLFGTLLKSEGTLFFDPLNGEYTFIKAQNSDRFDPAE